MFDLPTDLPADLAPLSWLVGIWEGTGVIDYADHAFAGEFQHRVSFSHDGGDYLNYSASAWLLVGLGGCLILAFAIQLGYGRSQGFTERVAASVLGALVVMGIISLGFGLAAIVPG